MKNGCLVSDCRVGEETTNLEDPEKARLTAYAVTKICLLVHSRDWESARHFAARAAVDGLRHLVIEAVRR